jgi:glyoxylase-like metal-dependent hydrolase (beta-lactamase superfamily II)
MFQKVSLLVALSAAVLFAQDQPAARGGRGGAGRGGPPNLATQMVKPGLFMITGAGANTEVRVTNDGLIVVDGKLPSDENYNALMDQIKMISTQPIKYLIVTHHHADHTGNNNKFLAAGVQIVANENLNKYLASYQQTPKPADATITYAKEYTVRLGGVTVEAHHFGNAHTGGDTVVYFPDLKLVAVSDEVTSGMTGPLADYAGGGSFVDWIPTLDSLLKLDFDTAIPGNGNPISKADVQTYRNKVATFVDRAKEAVRKGVPKDQLMAQVNTDDLGWKPRAPNVDPFYEELSKAK